MPKNEIVLTTALVESVRRRLQSTEMREFVRASLKELVEINTIPGPDIRDTAKRENAALELIENRALQTPCGVRIERVEILPRIEEFKEYTLPFYAIKPGQPAPPARDVYAGRHNLLVTLAGAAPARGDGLAMNAHIDTVAPYSPFNERAGRIWGRGSSDDKGSCVALLAAMATLGHLKHEMSVMPPLDVTFQFVIEEEMGGNGSMSLAIDDRYSWGCTLVCESTDLIAHPANRGATWYKIALEVAPDSGLSAALVAAHVLLELRAEGDRIKAESEHPLFPERPVQTCNGIMGPWGIHPSRVSPMVGVCVVGSGTTRHAEMRDAVERGVQAYCERYGDATHQPDPDDSSGPKVLRHHDLFAARDHAYIAVYGKSGHMGKIDELDCAATKAAYVMLELEKAFPDAQICLAAAPPATGQIPPHSPDHPVPVREPDETTLTGLTMEGGQGFVPTHAILDVQRRIDEAAERAVHDYAGAKGTKAGAVKVKTTYERLHNNAFERPVDCPGMRATLDAARAAGLYNGERIRGFGVSCDARLFADLRPKMDVVTFGPGQIRYAHSDSESITVDEILRAAEVLTYTALIYPKVG